MHWSGTILLLYVGLMAILMGTFVVNSWEEKERRAVRVGLTLFGAVVVVEAGLIALWRMGGLQTGSLPVYLADAVITAAGLILVLPTGRNAAARQGSAAYVTGAVQRFDQRDTVFSRINSLTPGRREYEEYYTQLHPERKAFDDWRRSLGGSLGVPGKIDKHNRFNLAALHALRAFPLLLGRRHVVRPEPKVEAADDDARELTDAVKGFAKHLGADLVGVTELDPRWVYSHRGEIYYENWEDWGTVVENRHTHAIVIATEMDREMIMARPHTPVTIESMHNYGDGAAITSQLAAFLANMGYQATANHFRHWEVLCVPLAIDAGLGELGRNGYLITREFGPRVRLAVVTTNAPLVADQPVDLGIQHFCVRCKKCAAECPSKSIPSSEKTIVNGLKRWKLDAESCNTWWAKVGTDCCICMAVCPWSHPNTLVHRLSKALATRSAVARRALIWADDFFYGKYKGPWYGQPWADYRRGKKDPVRQKASAV